MRIGVSSSCFYPLETEKSLETLGKLGVKTAEVFFNSPSELEKPFLSEICKIRDYYSMDIVSFHPFMSFGEGYYIFSNYRRRFEDSLELYKKMFFAAAQIGAKFVVLHGTKLPLQVDVDEYAQRYLALFERAKKEGVTLAHENVVYYANESPEFALKMKSRLGNDFKMVLDVKQARRAKQNPFEFIDIIGKNIVHLHLSDCLPGRDCLAPFEGGETDFAALFKKLREKEVEADAVVEIYRDNFQNPEELTRAREYLERIAKTI